MRNRIKSKSTYPTRTIVTLSVIQAAMITIPFTAETLLNEYTEVVSLAGYGISIILAVFAIGLTAKDTKDNHISKTALVIVMQIILIAVLIAGILKTKGII